MALTLKQWNEILNAARPDNNSNGDDILEKIKAKLKEQDEGTFQEWKQKGFDVNHLFNIQSNQTDIKRTLLHIAAFNGHLGIVKYLVDEKKVDVNKVDKDGKTALHRAAFNGHLGIVKYLVDEKKVDVNKADNYGTTALHMAAFNGHLDTVKYFVDEKKVDVNKANNYGETALHWAIHNGHLDIVKYLVEKNADVNKVDKHGRTVLHWAAKNGHLDTVKYLVEKGADPVLKDKHGLTPIDLARNENVEQFLQKVRTSLTQSNMLDKTEGESLASDGDAAHKAIATGVVLGVITALAVSIGCGAASVGLSALVITGIAVAAGLAIGVVAGGITYAISKPSDKLDEVKLKGSDQTLQTARTA